MSAVLLDTRPRRGKHRDRRPLLGRLLALRAVDHGSAVRASLRAAYGTTVVCSALLVVLTTVAAGVRL